MKSKEDKNEKFVMWWKRNLLLLLTFHFSLLQELCEFRNRSGTMADMVFDLHTEFGEGLVVAIGLKDGIIAEALPSLALTDDLTIDDALKLMDILDACTATGTDILLLY